MADTHKQPGPGEPDRVRRSFLQAGLAGGVGLLLGDLLPVPARADGPRQDAPAKALIQVCLTGGLSHLDSFDPKPGAGSACQSGLGTVQTRLSGVVFGELLKRTARVADRIAVCRSLVHDQESHAAALHYLFTGNPPAEEITFPSTGSVTAHELGVRDSLPPYACVPGLPALAAGPGALGEAFAPFCLGREPDARNYGARSVVVPWPEDNSAAAPDPGRISTRAARKAFDLDAEPAAVRHEYGRLGQKLLLARRLVEAGVRCVTVQWVGWDMHSGIRGALQRRLPEFDQAFAALVRDLERTGLLDSTLVLAGTEFGRSPRLNRWGGRDDWSGVFSAVLAGGGIKKGFVHGSSDATGAEPKDNPLSPADLAATVYHLLGIDPAKELTGGNGRAFAIVSDGKVRRELLA